MIETGCEVRGDIDIFLLNGSGIRWNDDRFPLKSYTPETIQIWLPPGDEITEGGGEEGGPWRLPYPGQGGRTRQENRQQTPHRQGKWHNEACCNCKHCCKFNLWCIGWIRIYSDPETTTLHKGLEGSPFYLFFLYFWFFFYVKDNFLASHVHRFYSLYRQTWIQYSCRWRVNLLPWR